MLFVLKHTAFHHSARPTVALLPFGVLTELVMSFGPFVYKDEHERSHREIPLVIIEKAESVFSCLTLLYL